MHMVVRQINEIHVCLPIEEPFFLILYIISVIEIVNIFFFPVTIAIFFLFVVIKLVIKILCRH